jgi:hypothetical protein
MSKRETIVQDVINTLKNADNPRFGLVSRDMIVLEKLSRQQFPALYIVTSDESRRDVTMNGPAGLREAILELRIVAWVSGTNLDHQRNLLVSNIENTLDKDRTRGGVAFYTQLTEVRTDFDTEDNYSRVDITIEVKYHYTRGNG